MAISDVTVAIPELSGQIQLILTDAFIEKVLAARMTAREPVLSAAEQAEAHVVLVMHEAPASSKHSAHVDVAQSWL